MFRVNRLFRVTRLTGVLKDESETSETRGKRREEGGGGKRREKGEKRREEGEKRREEGEKPLP